MKFSFKSALTAVFFLCIAAPALASSPFSPKIETVDQAYVKEIVGKPGFILVDVRVEELYGGKSPRPGLPGGHIPGSINFPLEDLDAEGAADALTEAGITKDITVVLYCNTGRQSGLFADALVTHFGFDQAKVKNYKGSIMEWSRDPANKLDPENHE